MYVPPLAVLNRIPPFEIGEKSVSLSRIAFEALLRAAFRDKAFDAAWYRATYLDVGKAIADGSVPDELTHFVRFGYIENRRPRAFDVDSDWYENTYADVGNAIRLGHVSDARSHFNKDGYSEPRAPDPDSASLYKSALDVAAGQSPTNKMPERPDRKK